MRILDFITAALALPLSALLLATLRLFGLRFNMERTLTVGKDARLFWRRRLVFRDGAFKGLANRLRLDHAPDLADLALGRLALVGPRPMAPLEPHAVASYRVAVRPGLISPFAVGAPDFVAGEGEDTVDFVYSARKTGRRDLEILIRAIRRAILPPSLTMRSAQ